MMAKVGHILLSENNLRPYVFQHFRNGFSEMMFLFGKKDTIPPHSDQKHRKA